MSYKDDLHIRISQSNSCELVALQYEALFEKTENIKKFILEKNSEKCFEEADNIRDILSNLIASLGSEKSDFKDKTIELYLYINKTVNNGILKEDINEFDNVLKILETLKDAWYIAGSNLRKTENSKNISNLSTYNKSGMNLNTSINDFGRV